MYIFFIFSALIGIGIVSKKISHKKETKIEENNDIYIITQQDNPPIVIRTKNKAIKKPKNENIKKDIHKKKGSKKISKAPLKRSKK